jgi:hypothetical protein
MLCPDCNKKLKCVESKTRVSGSVYRRYHCPFCRGRFSSKEALVGCLGVKSGKEGGTVQDSKEVSDEVGQARKSESSLVALLPQAAQVVAYDDGEDPLDSSDGDDDDDDEWEEDDWDESDEWEEDDEEEEGGY